MSLLLLLGSGLAVDVPVVEAPTQIDAMAVELALSGSYHDAVLADSPVGFWLLGDHLLATPADDLVGSNNGTYVGGMTFGTRGPFPHGGTAVALNGTSGFVTMGDVAAFEFTGAFSVEFLFRTTSAAAIGGLVGKADGGLSTGGWKIHLQSGNLSFHAYTSAGVAVFVATTTLTYNDGEWHHVVATWDGTTSANKVQVYVDGVVVKQATASAGTIGIPTVEFVVGCLQGPTLIEGSFLDGSVVGVAVYDEELSASRVAAHYATIQWTDITADVLFGPGLSIEYGTQGMKPLDRLADSGLLEFSLNNSSVNSAGLSGYYSPNHVNCRSGFTFDIPIRVRLTYDEVTYDKFWGRIVSIDPEPGQLRSRATHLLAHDYMFLLVDTDVREITPQLGQTETDLLRVVFDALPANAQPMALDFAANSDTYTYAFDNLEGGRKAATAINHVLMSAWGRGFVAGDGTFRYLNRQVGLGESIAFAVDDTMVELESISDRSNVFNDIRVVTHPKLIDAAATTILFSHPNANTAGQAPLVAANGGTLVIWPEGGYHNPDNDLMTVGGTSMVTPVSGTDFIAHQFADGTGTVLTGSVTVTADFFASTVKLTLTNNHATLGAYFTTLQVRGKGIYDLAPVTSEAISLPGNRVLPVDLPYQGNANTGQALADFILNERSISVDPIDAITVTSHRTGDLTSLAVASELGDLLAVSETQTGLTDAQGMIRSIRVEVGESYLVTTTLGLAPIVVGEAWILDDAVFSELDVTTIPAHG